jgi:hypothetical protein
VLFYQQPAIGHSLTEMTKRDSKVTNGLFQIFNDPTFKWLKKARKCLKNNIMGSKHWQKVIQNKYFYTYCFLSASQKL